MTPDEWFAQPGSRCRLEWGWEGAQRAAQRGDILVVVDVLSFSTAVATAVHYGGRISPCVSPQAAERIVKNSGGEIAVSRNETPEKGRFSLSPCTFLGMEAGSMVVLPSPNGATCCDYGRAAPALYVGALLNAQAVADAVSETLTASDCSVTVLACGERWQPASLDGALRFALEDYLGAGAILAALPHSKSPEAWACEAAFLATRDRLETMLWECGSGIELRERGYPDDVRHAAQLNLYHTVPLLRNGVLERADSHA